MGAGASQVLRISLGVMLAWALANAQTLTATGSLHTARAGQTATLLANGEVLIAGGNDGSGAARASAELYDPSSGTFTPTGSMKVARTGAVAVRLQSGNVFLVAGSSQAGGQGGADSGPSAPEATTEIYDVASGAFRAGPKLPTPLDTPAAVLLGDGRVWVSGVEHGCDGSAHNCISPVEIYDPHTNAFHGDGPLAAARVGAGAALLTTGSDSGDVLVISGGDPNSASTSPIDTAEIDDPAHGEAVQLVPEIAGGLWNTQAEPLDGGDLLIEGGSHAGESPYDWELYDATAQKFAALAGSSSAPFPGVLVVLPDGSVLVGGTGVTRGDTTGIYIYNPDLQSFSRAASLAAGRVRFTATTLSDGRVLIAGGNSASATATPGQPAPVLASAVIFHPASASADFALQSDQTQAVVSTATSAAFHLSVLATGGFNGAVELSCGKLSAKGACAFTPLAITPGQTSTLTVSGLDLTAGSTVDIPVTGISGQLAHTLDLRIDLEPPRASISPATLDFGQENVGQTSASQTVALANSGASTLQIAGIAIQGDFAQTNDCGASIGNGAPGCTITITFQPSTAGARSGDLQISDDAPFSPQTVALSGTGVVPPAPQATLAPSSLSFASQAVGQSSASQTVTLTNSGNAALTLGAIAASGDFSESNTCSASLAAGQSCAIAVVFDPTAAGARGGSLSIADNAKDSPQQLALTGAAVASTSASSPPSGSEAGTPGGSGAGTPSGSETGTSGGSGAAPSGSGSGSGTSTSGSAGTPSSNSVTMAAASGTSMAQSVNPGQSATYSLTLVGANNFTGTIALACTGAPGGMNCTPDPATVAIGATPTPVAVSVQPAATAAASVLRLRVPPSAPWSNGQILLALLAAASLAGLVCVRRQRRPILCGLGFALVLALAGCGGSPMAPTDLGPSPPPAATPAGTYTLHLTASDNGAPVGATQLTLTVR